MYNKSKVVLCCQRSVVLNLGCVQVSKFPIIPMNVGQKFWVSFLHQDRNMASNNKALHVAPSGACYESFTYNTCDFLNIKIETKFSRRCENLFSDSRKCQSLKR